jgi:hypothetical protein
MVGTGTVLRRCRCGGLAGLLALACAAAATAQPATCTKPEFESVVDDAAAALRELNQ